jgi:hypothetical protein
LTVKSDLGDEIHNIMKELEKSGNEALNSGNTLNDMIKNGLVKGLPKGTQPDVGLEDQGISLPIKPNKITRPNLLKPNSMEFKANKNGKGRNLINKMKSILKLNGKITCANNFERFPNLFNGHTITNHQKAIYRIPPPPQPISMDHLNAIGLNPHAYRNLIQKNNEGSLNEYMNAVKSNFTTKYDMLIQKEIAEIQKKPFLLTETGQCTPISVDGPGIECPVPLKTTSISFTSRFSGL